MMSMIHFWRILPNAMSALSRRGSTPGSAPRPPLRIMAVVRLSAIILRTEARKWSLGVSWGIAATGGMRLAELLILPVLFRVLFECDCGRSWLAEALGWGERLRTGTSVTPTSSSEVRDSPSMSERLFSLGMVNGGPCQEGVRTCLCHDGVHGNDQARNACHTLTG